MTDENEAKSAQPQTRISRPNQPQTTSTSRLPSASQSPSTSRPATVAALPAADIETQLFQMTRKEFDGGTVTIKRVGISEPKLANRGFTEEQLQVRVEFISGSKKYAVAGMVPVSANADALKQLMGRMKQDKLKAEDAINPRPAV